MTIRGFGLLLWLLFCLPVFADDADLPELLARVRQNGPVEFNYQETRTLELTSSPWKGQGLMLSGGNGVLVKLQLQPRRIVMISTDQRLYYWDHKEHRRHSVTTDQAGAGAQQITLLRSIVQGRVQDLQSNYDMTADRQGKRWFLRFKPKPGINPNDAPVIEFSGDEDKNAHRVDIVMADGESTQYRLRRTAEGQQVENDIRRLLLEATGD